MKTLSELTGTQIDQLKRGTTVFFIPVGGYEDRGAGMPLGQDLLHAQRICQELAAKIHSDLKDWEAVALPGIALSLDPVATRIDLRVRGHVLRDYLVDTCLGLWRLGFTRFVCVSGTLTPKQLTAIEEAGRIIRRRASKGFVGRWSKKNNPQLVSASSALVTRTQVFESPLWPDPQEHGARRDRSIAYALGVAQENDLLKLNTTQKRPSSKWRRFFERKRRTLSGPWEGSIMASSTLSASQDEGHKLIQDEVDILYPKLRALWDGGSPDGLFRSWYSVFWPNRSFFSAWMLSALIALLLAVWVYFSFRMLVG